MHICVMCYNISCSLCVGKLLPKTRQVQSSGIHLQEGNKVFSFFEANKAEFCRECRNLYFCVNIREMEHWVELFTLTFYQSGNIRSVRNNFKQIGLCLDCLINCRVHVHVGFVNSTRWIRGSPWPSDDIISDTRATRQSQPGGDVVAD